MQELIEKRDWDRKLFDTGRVRQVEGKPDRPIYGTKIQSGLHDIEPDGSYIDIDPLFMTSDDGDETDRVRRTRCGRISISNKLEQSKDRIKVLTKSGNGITLKLKGLRTYGPHFNDLRSCYYTTDEGYILRYYPYYKGVKLVIEIPNPQTSTNIFRFVVREIGCDYTYEETAKGIKCISSTGEDDLFIINPYAVDANGDYGQVNLKLGEETPEGYQIIRKVINPVWLGNAAGPALADPDVTITDLTGTLEDTFMNVSSPTTNFGTNAALAFKDYAAGEKLSTLLYVDLSGEPGGTVLNGRFGIDLYSLSGSEVNLQWFKVLVTWAEGTATWNVPWTTAGCKGSGVDRAVASDGTATITATSSDYHFDLLAATIQSWLDSPSTNFGELIEGQGGDLSGTSLLGRSSEAVSGNIPYFFYEYTEGVTGSVSHVAFSIYDKHFNAFNELSGKNTIV